MRGYPIAEYKIEAPPLPDGTLRRDRLLDRLSADATRRVIVLVAEAGYGKTTLLADWSGRGTRRVAWYRIDEGDRDWITFLRYLVAAGQVCQPAFAPVTADLVTDIAATGLAMEAIVEVFVGELAGLVDPPTALILDDYHLVDDVPEIRRIMRQIVRRVPPGLTLVISGRRRPKLPLAKLLTHGELAELTTEDLRFSLEETARLFRESYQRPLEQDVVESLCHRTEGWAAALQLVEAATRDRTLAETRSFINALSGGKSHLYEYLAEEVIGVLEPNLQHFLMQTAALQRVEPELAAVAAERPIEEARQALDAASRAGLLPPPGKHERPQRFHPLVAEFLLTRLAAEIGPDGVAAIHRRVARHLEGSDWRLACHHYAAAGDHGAARKVAEAALHDVMASGDYAFAERYLSGDGDGGSVALDIVRSRLDFNRNDMERALALARSAASNPPPHLRDAALANLMTIAFGTGNIEEAADLATGLKDRARGHYRWLAEGTLAVIAACRGSTDLHAAAGVMRQMAETQRAAGMPRYLGITLNNLMSILRPMGKMAELLACADEAVDALTRGGKAPEVANVMVMRAWAEAHLGQTTEARRDLAVACETSQLAVRADVLVEGAELHIALGEAADAQEYLDEAETLCARAAPSLEMWRTAQLWLRLRTADVDGAVQQATELSDQVTYNPGQRAVAAALRGHLAYLKGARDAR
ncbi:MAG: hypothetical protein C4343_01135, partial [Chloroflexota bacterium]